MPDEPLPTLAEVRGIMSRQHEQDAAVAPNIDWGDVKLPTRTTPNRTAHTIMVTCRMPYEMDRRLTALAKATHATKTALMLMSVEALLKHAKEVGDE